MMRLVSWLFLNMTLGFAVVLVSVTVSQQKAEWLGFGTSFRLMRL